MLKKRFFLEQQDDAIPIPSSRTRTPSTEDGHCCDNITGDAAPNSAIRLEFIF